MALLLVVLMSSACSSGGGESQPEGDDPAGDQAEPAEEPADPSDADDEDEGGAASSAQGFVVHVGEEPGSGTSTLYVLDLQTGEQRPLIDDGGGFNEGPSVSPDGTRVSFESDRTGDWELYVVDIDGENLTRLTDSPGQDSQPDWSPDGSQLVFESERDGDFDVYVLELATEQIRQLTDDDAWDGAPVWSPDGSTILFHSDRDDGSWFDLWTMDPDGDDQVLLVQDGLEPAWSPDGTSISYDFERDIEGKDIWLVDADGSNPRALIAGEETWDEGTAWLPDGSTIVFASDRTGPFHLHTVQPDGSQITELTTGGLSTYEPAPSG